MNNKELDVAVYATGLLLAISVLLPITSLPIVGDVSYFRIAENEAYIVIGCCLVTPVLLLLDKSKLMILPPLGVWVTLLYPAIEEMLKGDKGLFAQVTGQSQRILREFASDLFLNVTEFSWGGYVFLAALAGFTITCVIRTFR